MQSVQVYLDVPFIGALLGWIQDATLLWMVAQVSGTKVDLKRLLCGGLVGGIFQFILLVNQVSTGLLNPWILSPLLFLIAVPLLMVYLTFCPCSFRGLLRILGYFYLLSFLLSGIHWGLDSVNDHFVHWEITIFWRFWLHLMFIFILGELGWGIIHQKLWEQICLYPIQIDWDGQQLKLNALLDTGNRLYDPLTKVPVIIIELRQIKSFLPKEVIGLTECFNLGELGSDWDLPSYWLERVRILPFNSLGQEHGILIGFRPDQIKIWLKKQEIVSKNVVVALYNRTLSQADVFQALIPPAILGTGNRQQAIGKKVNRNGQWINRE